MQTISLKISDDLAEALEREARTRRITKSRIVRESLEQSLRKPPGKGKKSAYDLAAHVAGSIKGLPRDLAINPKYMDGFGE